MASVSRWGHTHDREQAKRPSDASTAWSSTGKEKVQEEDFTEPSFTPWYFLAAGRRRRPQSATTSEKGRRRRPGGRGSSNPKASPRKPAKKDAGVLRSTRRNTEEKGDSDGDNDDGSDARPSSARASMSSATSSQVDGGGGQQAGDGQQQDEDEDCANRRRFRRTSTHFLVKSEQGQSLRSGEAGDGKLMVTKAKGEVHPYLQGWPDPRRVGTTVGGIGGAGGSVAGAAAEGHQLGLRFFTWAEWKRVHVKNGDAY